MIGAWGSGNLVTYDQMSEHFLDESVAEKIENGIKIVQIDRKFRF